MEKITKECVEKLINFSICDIKLYQKAFIHKSACRDLELESNERLEFVGDSVISLIVAKHLYDKYPNENEGYLTRLRTKLVSSKGLSMLANNLGLQDLIIMNEKAMSQKWNTNPRILEDAFESLIGAIYLDLGLSYCRDFFLDLVERFIDFEETEKDTNYKDILMRYSQSNGFQLPEYLMFKESGPDHQKYFTVVVKLLTKTVGEGSGKTKKDAEQIAAYHVLKCVGVVA